jgi:hypothetical protein
MHPTIIRRWAKIVVAAVFLGTTAAPTRAAPAVTGTLQLDQPGASISRYIFGCWPRADCP